MLDHVKRNVNRLDDRTAHVENVKSAVGCVHEIDGAEPVVRRAYELGSLLARSTNCLKRWSVRNQDSPMNQIVLGVTNEDVAVKLGGPRTATVNRGASTCINNMVTGSGRFSGTGTVSDPPA